MIVCVTCKLEMKCVETGLGARFYDAHVYPGDAFLCDGCNAHIIKTTSSPVHDPERKIKTIQIKEVKQ
jgi:hypothetical protein